MAKKFNYFISSLLVIIGIIIGSMGFIIGNKLLGNTEIQNTEVPQIDDENYQIINEIMKIVEENAYFIIVKRPI